MNNKGSLVVLVIEDNPGDFTLVEEFLFDQIESPFIVNAHNYKEAVEIIGSGDHAFDIILLDLSLPDKTGMPLIEEIIEISAKVPVVVLTGYADLTFGVKSLAMGISDYILKDELTALSLYKSIVYSIERKRIIYKLESSEKRARSFATQLNNVLEEERSRIAREIHDEFGQQLSGLKMSLSSLRKFTSSHEVMEPVIDSLITDVNNSIQSVRQIANELRPVLIDKLGLFAAIEWLVSDFEKKTGISCNLYVDINQPPISKMQEINIFRICQEALTNIIKHAEASNVNIDIENKDKCLHIRIADNGKGIKTTLLNSLSMGLLNMQERANLIGATVSISSPSGNGTMVELILNIDGKENFNSRRSLSDQDRG
jgi:signal transduction histidine kinase